jgi:hypothetical protein
MTFTRLHRVRSGRIDYLIDNPDFPQKLWGVEHWRMTAHEDHLVMRSYCELNDEVPLVRDVIQAVDLAFHPHDTYVRLTQDNRFLGSTWYRFSDSEAEYQGFTAQKGRIQEKVAISRAMRGFGAHALNSDAWLAARFDLSKGPGIQTFSNNLLTSIDHRGATGPAFEYTVSSSLQYFGIESVSVKSGVFDCHHFAFVNTSNNHPPYDFWVTSDGDFLYVKGVVTEPYNWSFELVELTDGRE